MDSFFEEVLFIKFEIPCVFLPKVYLLTRFGPKPTIPLIPPVPKDKFL